MCFKSTEPLPEATMTKSYKGNDAKHERLNCTIIEYNLTYMRFPFMGSMNM